MNVLNDSITSIAQFFFCLIIILSESIDFQSLP